MRYRSTRAPEHVVDLRTAVLQGVAPDGGLYTPVELPRIEPDRLEAMAGERFVEVAFELARALLADDLTGSEIDGLVHSAFDFPVPVTPLGDGRTWLLELHRGPTGAFKDFGARFLARLIGALDGRGERTVVVATSGDTGGAVANAFHGLPGIRVVVLFPEGKVSEYQRLQFSALGGNVTAVGVHGTFDDCQRLVKEAFADEALRGALGLTSANSINIGRLIPQIFYHVYAWTRVGTAVGAVEAEGTGESPGAVEAEGAGDGGGSRGGPGSSAVPRGPQVSLIVPSGNLGNLTAAAFATRMGVPYRRLIAATNRNDILPEYLRTGDFRPRPSVRTVSNAMDVGAPSNFERLLALFSGDIEEMRRLIVGSAHDDEATLGAIRTVHERFGRVIDPHTAVGWLAWEALRGEGEEGIVAATADPVKFEAVMSRALSAPPRPPVEERDEVVIPLERPTLAELARVMG